MLYEEPRKGIKIAIWGSKVFNADMHALGSKYYLHT